MKYLEKCMLMLGRINHDSSDELNGLGQQSPERDYGMHYD